MARGDVISALSSVAAGGFLVYQPASGVEVLIRRVGSSIWTGTAPNQTPYTSIQLQNAAGDITTVALAGNPLMFQLPVFVTNSVYLRLPNLDGTTAAYMSFSGIQTK